MQNTRLETRGSFWGGLARLVEGPMAWLITLIIIPGLVVAVTPIQIPSLLAIPIEMMGQVSIPLMLFSLGVRLIHVDWRAWRIGVAGAIVCPLTGILIAFALGTIFQLDEMQYAILLLFGALPPGVLNFMLAERFDQQPELVASIVMIGNVASILVIPGMLYFVL